MKTTADRATQEANVTARLSEIGIGKTTTVRGIAVTRWSQDMFELETWGRYTEKLCEAAANLVAMTGQFSLSMSREHVIGGIRSMLGYNSTASKDAIKTAIAGDNDTNRAIVDGIVEEMIADGGLEYSERGWLYCPRPAAD